MDALGGLLQGARAQGAFLLRTVMEPPWAMRIEDEAPVTVVAVARGSAWLLPDGAEPARLGPGDLAIVRGPEHYVVADDPATRPRILIHPGQRCTTLRGADVSLEMSLGVRTWGNSEGGGTVLLTGTYEGHSEIAARLLVALPRLVVVRDDDWDSPLVALLGSEIVKTSPGQEVVLDRLLDLLLIAALRNWLSRTDVVAPAWWRADSDPVIGRAVRLIHNDPGRPWTIAGLAAASGMSRAGFARRFTDVVGEPPIAFLTGWRLALAADLLRDPDVTVAAAARQVGYGTPFALSTAFKRAYGVSPREHRRASSE